MQQVQKIMRRQGCLDNCRCIDKPVGTIHAHRFASVRRGKSYRCEAGARLDVQPC
jgi:hypothetical protein